MPPKEEKIKKEEPTSKPSGNEILIDTSKDPKIG